MKVYSCILLILSAVFLFPSCSDDAINTNENENRYLWHELKFPKNIDENDIIGYLDLCNYRSVNIDGKTQEARVSSGGVFFYDEDYHEVGKVYLDNQEMEYFYSIFDPGPGGIGEYYWSTESLPFQEQLFTWHGNGDSLFPKFEIKLQAPASTYKITSPEFPVKINMTSPLTITWERADDAGKNSVKIELEGKSGDEHISKFYFTKDTGAFTIPAADIKSFTVIYDIVLIVGRNTLQEVLHGKYIYAEIISRFHLNL